VHLAKMWIHCRTNVSFQNYLLDLIKFSMTNTSQNSIFLIHLKFKDFQIIVIRSYSLRSYQESAKILLSFFVLIWMKFECKTCSISHNFSTISPNIMKPNLCTPICGGLSNGTKRHKKPHDLGEVISTWHNKQN